MKTTFSKSLRLLSMSCVAIWLVAPRAFANEARFFRIVGPTATTITAFTPDGYITWTNAQIETNYTVQTARSLGAATNWVDYIQIPASNSVVTHRLYDPNPPSGMVLIPAGSFMMGDCMDTNESSPRELPLHTVYVSAFYMDSNLVSYTLWTNVYQWATNHGYSFDLPGRGKAADHPVQMVCWYDVAKWCNARSEMENLTPCYYTNASLGPMTIYRSGGVDLDTNWVSWANGYRLPTEAEWEKAARGGAGGHRFPWSDADTIDWSRANYAANPGIPSYDVNLTRSTNPAFTNAPQPYTSPVGSFAANGYGLYDMAGNVWEWCWDTLSETYYSSSPETDPRGPGSSPNGYRIHRGGCFESVAPAARCAQRAFNRAGVAYRGMGFRSVREH